MKVRINLSALTRMYYTEEIEVPDGTTPEELDDLVDEKYNNDHEIEFLDDDTFWERGTCYWEKLDDEGKVVRSSEGDA